MPRPNPWNAFFDFLCCESAERPDELRQELNASGVDVDRVNLAVAALLRRNLPPAPAAGPVPAPAPGWLQKARRAQAAFESRAAELARAIASGQLGPRVQAHAQVFFRNRDLSQLSERELNDFIHDCELLNLIEKEKDKKK